MMIMDLLGGAVWMRVVFRQLPLGADFAESVVDIVLSGLRHRP
jgi:hypothetical protein